mmetsp:Transcript_17438/g.16640  ORF Transcript_17438/g.16640 Transcript_17438/m.16640 type:complete len:82 (+) Transcript_17438:184-429(+)
MDKDFKCSICLGLYVKPITTICGHTFCQVCLFKYFLSRTKNCPLCRRYLPQEIGELSINVSFESLSKRVHPGKYMKMSAIN